MYLRLDSVGFNKKPEKSEIAGINKRLSAESRDVEWPLFCDLVGNSGHSFCISDFCGERKNSNFKSQRIFALDFDNTVAYDTIKVRAKKYRLPIALSYETFSSENCSNFRVVFLLDTAVTDTKTSNSVTQMFMEIFYECDRKCSDPARMFFGGKGIIEQSGETVSLETLNIEFNRFLKDKYGEKHYKEKVSRFAGKNNINTKNGFTDITGDIAGESISKTRNFRFERLAKVCRLYHEFEKGDIWLYHDQLFGILTNMVNIDGGNRLFLTIVNNEDNIEYGYVKKDLRYYINYMVKMDYRPQRCDAFCLYCDECNHAANMINTAKTAQNTVTKLKDKSYFSLEEASANLYENFENAINSKANGIYIIRAQTAIGKTHCYVNKIKHSKKLFIIAVPTNILKDEVYDRLISEGIPGVVKTYSIQEIECMQTEIGGTIKTLNNLGAHREVVDYLKNIAREENNPHYLNYIRPLHKYYNEVTRVIVTTHKKLMGADPEFLRKFEIIIDEDILMSASKNTYEVKIKDLLKLNNTFKIEQILKTEYEFVKTEPVKYQVSLKEMREKGITSNVNAFFSSSAVYKDGNTLYCFIPPTLPDVKLTILSATAEKEIYEMFFKDRIIHFYECIEAKYKGRLIQYCGRSYSRRDLDSDPDFFKKIKAENPNFNYIITFMKYKSQADDCNIHFGNTEGCDYMKGKNIMVVGTPHYNEVVYKLIACHIGIDTNCKMRFREVDDTCYRYWLNTYDNPELRKIQLWMLRSELVQAVGRARLMRYDCTVKLYAGIPMEQAEIVYDHN